MAAKRREGRQGKATAKPCTPLDEADLRKAIAKGIEEAERGELSPWDPDEVWAEVERRNAERMRGRTRNVDRGS